MHNKKHAKDKWATALPDLTGIMAQLFDL